MVDSNGGGGVNGRVTQTKLHSSGGLPGQMFLPQHFAAKPPEISNLVPPDMRSLFPTYREFYNQATYDCIEMGAQNPLIHPGEIYQQYMSVMPQVH